MKLNEGNYTAGQVRTIADKSTTILQYKSWNDGFGGSY